MLNSLRGCVCNSEVGDSRQLYKLGVTTQLSKDLPGLLGSRAVLAVGLLGLLLVVGVILPAVWSRERTRRAAALKVLERLLRWRS
jgi:hypothetical protein